MSEWRKIWANGLPNEGRSPKSAHRMAAEGMQFPWRWNGGTISLNLGVIWEMSGEAEKERRDGSLTIFVLFAGNLTNGTLP